MRGSENLKLSVEKVVGDLLESSSFLPENGKSIERFLGQAAGFRFRFFEAHDGRVGCFIDRFILAGGFAQLFSRLGHVEDVIDDLKGEAKVVAKSGERFELSWGCIRRHASQAQGSGKESRSFIFVNTDELRFAEVLALSFEIEDLSTNEFFRATTDRELKHDVLERIALSLWGLGEDGEGLGKEGVAGENSHAFAINLMRGRAPAAEVIVIHAGEIIVNERVSVHDFDSTCRRERPFFFTSTSFRSGEGQNGAQAFPTGKNGVAHRLMHCLRASGGLGQERIESSVDGFLLRLEIRFQFGHARFLNEKRWMPKLESSESRLKYLEHG